MQEEEEKERCEEQAGERAGVLGEDAGRQGGRRCRDGGLHWFGRGGDFWAGGWCSRLCAAAGGGGEGGRDLAVRGGVKSAEFGGRMVHLCTRGVLGLVICLSVSLASVLYVQQPKSNWPKTLRECIFLVHEILYVSIPCFVKKCFLD